MATLTMVQQLLELYQVLVLVLVLQWYLIVDTTRYTTSTYDSTNEKVVIAYRDQGNSNQGTAIVGTVSGTSISFGSEVVFNSGNTDISQPHMTLLIIK